MKVVDLKQFVKLGTPPPMLVARALPEKSLMVIVGEPYTGKSLIALDLALSVALGESALQRFPARQANVLYVAADAPSWYGAWQASAMLRGRGYDEDTAPEGHLWFAPPGQGLRVLETEAATEQFIREVADFNVELVVLDTLRKMHTQDENSSGVMTMVVDRCRMINEAGIAVILVHHASKPSGKEPSSAAYRGRGSTVVPGEVDINWLVEKRPQASRVEVAKGRGASLEGPFDIQIRAGGDSQRPQLHLHWAPPAPDPDPEPRAPKGRPAGAKRVPSA